MAMSTALSVPAQAAMAAGMPKRPVVVAPGAQFTVMLPALMTSP